MGQFIKESLLQPGFITVPTLANLAERTGVREDRGQRFAALMLESIAKGKIKPEQISLHALARAVVGENWDQHLDPDTYYGGAIPWAQIHFSQEDSAVGLSAFANITGQLVFSKILRGWQEADAGVFEALFSVVPSNLSGEKIPGMGAIEDEEMTLHDGKEVPLTGFGEEYIEKQETVGKGLRCAVTKEAVFFDRTGAVLRNAGRVGERLMMSKLKDALRVFTGISNPYKRKGTQSNTYLTSGGYVNSDGGIPLVDWNSIDQARKLMKKIRHPDTNNPLAMSPAMTLVVPPALGWTARRIVSATEIRHADSSDTDTSRTTISSNPVTGVTVVESAVLQMLLDEEGGLSEAQADATWFLGDVHQAFEWTENWGIQTRQAAPNAGHLHTHRIVADFLSEHRGAADVMEPRVIGKFGYS